MLSMPAALASSTPYWMIGLSTSGSISLGCAFVTGRNRAAADHSGARSAETSAEYVGRRDRAGQAAGARHDAGAGGQPRARAADQAARDSARRHRGPAEQSPPHLAEPAARERPGGKERRRQQGSAPPRRAAQFRLRAEAALGP